MLTDSGGLQEEAPSLGKPVLVLRNETERPEAVEAGTVKVVGTEKENIIEEASRLLEDENEYRRMAHSVNPTATDMLPKGLWVPSGTGLGLPIKNPNRSFNFNSSSVGSFAVGFRDYNGQYSVPVFGNRLVGLNFARKRKDS